MRDDFITKSRELSCSEAELMIPDFLDDKLSDRDTAAFINHVQDCSRCYSELETNFMVEQTVRYLNDEDSGSFNLKPLLKSDITARRDRLLNKRFWSGIRLIAAVVTAVLVSLLILDLTGIFRITTVFGF